MPKAKSSIFAALLALFLPVAAMASQSYAEIAKWMVTMTPAERMATLEKMQAMVTSSTTNEQISELAIAMAKVALAGNPPPITASEVAGVAAKVKSALVKERADLWRKSAQAKFPKAALTAKAKAESKLNANLAEMNISANTTNAQILKKLRKLSPDQYGKLAQKIQNALASMSPAERAAVLASAGISPADQNDAAIAAGSGQIPMGVPLASKAAERVAKFPGTCKEAMPYARSAISAAAANGDPHPDAIQSVHLVAPAEHYNYGGGAVVTCIVNVVWATGYTDMYATWMLSLSPRGVYTSTYRPSTP